MVTIGTFTEKDGKLVGKIQTLSLNAALTFLPNQSKSSPEAPAYRVFSGRTEVGGAWEKTAESTGRTYHSVRLDDPTFAAPFFANLVTQNEGGFALIWSRPQRGTQTAGAADKARRFPALSIHPTELHVAVGEGRAGEGCDNARDRIALRV